jgi:hypothetical protein
MEGKNMNTDADAVQGAEAAAGVVRSNSPAAAPRLGSILLSVAWLSILLGLVIELILVLLAAGYGTFANAKPLVADLVQKVSWSTIVCVGIALGTAASNMRASLMGVMGLLAAPLGFTVARTLHKAVAEALGVAGVAAGGPSPLLIGSIKGVEYACLGALLGWVGNKYWGGALAHIAVGLGAGIFFGGTILGLMDWHSPVSLPLAAFLPGGVDEILFPVGCALVLFAAESLGKRGG